MGEQNYHTEIDHLALGLTRSPMFMGVNIRMFFANVVLSALLCVDAHTFWGIPLFLVLHLWMVKLSVNEPNFFSIYMNSFLKTPPILNRWYWGKTNSYGPW